MAIPLHFHILQLGLFKTTDWQSNRWSLEGFVVVENASRETHELNVLNLSLLGATLLAAGTSSGVTQGVHPSRDSYD